MSQFAYDYNPTKKDDIRKQQISCDKFYDWSQNHMYRTSYCDMWTNRPQEPKNVAYPGYGGFIPGLKSSNQYGKGFSPIARESFSQPKLGKNPFKLSSTGFNFKRHDFIDNSLTASSHKYGCQTIQKIHPNLGSVFNESQNKATYKDPKQQVQPTYRETDKHLQTSKQETLNSGFVQNHKTFDGTGWVPNKILDANRVQTEYRLRYNIEVPFHRETTLFKVRKMKNKEYNYKFN